MDQVTLRAEPRTESGSRPARRLRREGLIPAVVYGSDLDTIPVKVAARDLFSVLHTEAGLNALINLELDGGDTLLTVAREIQRHPVRGDITHLDFINIALDVAIEAEVGVEYVGVPASVQEGEGFVETIESSVLVSALPMEVPSGIQVDIGHLEIGDTLLVSDLPQIEGVEYLDDSERPLVTVIIPRIEEEPEPEVDELEEMLEEGELPEGEEGEAPEGEEGAAEEESAEEEG